MLVALSCILSTRSPVLAQDTTGLLDQCVDTFKQKHRLDDSYIGPDGCNTCRCAEVGNLCTRRFCEPKTKMTSEANKCVDNRGNLHKLEESYTHVDGCNTCVCKEFGGACTRRFCFKASRDAVRSVCKDADGNGRQEGDVWTAADGCNTCRCGALGPLCTKIGCLGMANQDPHQDKQMKGEPVIVDETGDSPCTVNGVTKFPGDSWLTEDSCNICTCTGVNGKAECTEESCRARFLRLVDPKQLTGEAPNSCGTLNLSLVVILSSILASIIV
jgi:hypothetical protein